MISGVERSKLATLGAGVRIGAEERSSIACRNVSLRSRHKKVTIAPNKI